MLPSIAANGRYGLGDVGDVGGYVGIDRFTPSVVMAFGGSYRHYWTDWFRVAVDSTYHHATRRVRDSDGRGVYCDPNGTFFFWCLSADDFLSTRIFAEFSHHGEVWGMHAGPMFRSGLWIPDPGRPRREDAGSVGSLGFQPGVLAGVSLRASDRVDVQADVQGFYPLIMTRDIPGVTGTPRYGSLNVIRGTLSVYYRF